MDWVAAAEEFIGKYGWGARGRNLGVSRMFGTGDISSLVRNVYVATYRPRGVLSGFLAVMPNNNIVFIPPIAAKVVPQRLRLRIDQSVFTNGAVFSAYFTRTAPRKLVIEDVLVWNGVDVWSNTPFKERWNNILFEFITKHFRADSFIQGFDVILASYKSPKEFAMPDNSEVFELVPIAAGVKRYIWMPPRTASATTAQPSVGVAEMPYTATKELGMGPDVYAIYKGSTRLGLALVRTLAISKALRLAISTLNTSTPVRAELNKTFDKYEILEVLAAT